MAVAHRLSRPRILGDPLPAEYVDNSYPQMGWRHTFEIKPSRKPEAPNNFNCGNVVNHAILKDGTP